MTRGQTVLSPSGPKTNAGPDAREVEQVVDRAPPSRCERRAGRSSVLQDDQREDDLQAEAPGDRAAVDRAAVRRQQRRRSPGSRPGRRAAAPAAAPSCAAARGHDRDGRAAPPRMVHSDRPSGWAVRVRGWASVCVRHQASLSDDAVDERRQRRRLARRSSMACSSRASAASSGRARADVQFGERRAGADRVAGRCAAARCRRRGRPRRRPGRARRRAPPTRGRQLGASMPARYAGRAARARRAASGAGGRRRVVVDDARVAALALDHLRGTSRAPRPRRARRARAARRPRRRARRRRARSIRAASGTAERLEIGGPAALQRLERLDDLERVADGAAERRVHRGDQRLGADARRRRRSPPATRRARASRLRSS